MWCCFRHRCVVEQFLGLKKCLPLQLRLSTDDEKTKKLKRKDTAVWGKQIVGLVRKREMLALISEYIKLQEKYVDSKLRSNKELLDHAKNSWNNESK